MESFDYDPNVVALNSESCHKNCIHYAVFTNVSGVDSFSFVFLFLYESFLIEVKD